MSPAPDRIIIPLKNTKERRKIQCLENRVAWIGSLIDEWGKDNPRSGRLLAEQAALLWVLRHFA